MLLLQLAAVVASCALLPPLAVFFATGLSSQLIITFLLTAMFWFPGSAYALWVCWDQLLAGGAA